jgi:hypothetical protein
MSKRLQWKRDNFGETGCTLRAMVAAKSLNAATGLGKGRGDLVGSNIVLAGVGRAVVPFARALILMLRSATIRERQQKKWNHRLIGTHCFRKSSPVRCLSGPDTGIRGRVQILKALQGPNPSALIDHQGKWWSLINRWLVTHPD